MPPRNGSSRRYSKADAGALIRETIFPRAIDTSNGFLDLIREVYRLGQEDGRRAMASKGGNVRRAKSFEAQIARWRVYSDYFQRAGRQAWAHPYSAEHLRKLKEKFEAKPIKASIATIRADIRKLKNASR